MAAIDTTAATTRKRKGFAQKLAGTTPKIDMTPMVDLVLLLIVFFVFTTSMTSPNTVDLYMPETDGPASKTPESGSLTILLGSDQIYYYEGILKEDGSNIVKTNFSDLRNEISRKKNEVIASYVPDAACEAEAVANKKPLDHCRQRKLMVLIKPGADANYKTIVDVLDEMTINKILRYAIVEPDKEEMSFLK